MRCKHQKSRLAAIALKLQRQNKPNNQGGFTIIESLIAIIVVAILMTAIAPVILLSTATRLQARRVELATQAAKAYIDGVVAGNIDAPAESDKDNIANTPVPVVGSISSCDSGKYCSTDKKLFCVDGDNDNKCLNTSPKDLIVQSFRTKGDASKGFGLGVRVYRGDGFKDGEPFKKGEKQSTIGSAGRGENGVTEVGLGNRKTPLVEMTTDISTDTNFTNFCQRLQNNNNSQSNCGTPR